MYIVLDLMDLIYIYILNLDNVYKLLNVEKY